MFHVFAQAEANHVEYWFNQGFAVLVLLGIGWGLYKWITWANVNVIIPVKDAGIEHLRETTATMRQVQTTLADQHANIANIRTSVQALDERTQEIADTLKRQA